MHGMLPNKNDVVSGRCLAFLAAVIFAGWLPATRLAVEAGIAPLDLALMRYGIPTILLAPIWWRLDVVPKGVSVSSFLMMMAWGAPFAVLISTALENASVAHTAALVPCTMPLLAALIAWLLFGQPIQGDRKIGMAFIALAAAIVLLSIMMGSRLSQVPTILLLLLASLGWAAYTVSFRRSGLSPLQAASFVCLWSTILLVPSIAVFGTSLSDVPLPSLAFHIFCQGILTGSIATVAYSSSIERLGTLPASAFSALIPMLATCGALLWLGEIPSTVDMIGLSLGTLGVAIVNGVIRVPSMRD